MDRVIDLHRLTRFVLAAALLPSVAAATSDPLALLDAARPGSEVRLDAIVLDGDKQPAPMRLHEVLPWASDAVIVLHEADGPREVTPPPARFFRGELENEPGSRVFLRFDERGEVKGLVMSAGGAWVLDERRGKAATLRARTLHDDALHHEPGSFSCRALPPPGGNGGKNLIVDAIHGATDAPTAAPAADRHVGDLRQWKDLLQASPKAAAPYLARVAVETDHEYFQLHGNSIDAAQYMADVFAFISGIYEAEVQTALAISRLDLYPTPDDPWTQGDTDCALSELGLFWNTQRTDVPRTITHFVSGKPMGGGIAWLGALCASPATTSIGSCPGLPATGQAFGGYGVSGGLYGTFNAANPGVVWDMVVIAHEIGHNFGSPHTHCYGGIKGNASPVDGCAIESGSGCFGGPTPSLPGPMGQGSGTLMSYCHLLEGGYANISPTFGTGHPYGVQPGRVPQVMLDHVSSRPAACLAAQDGLRLTLAERRVAACAGSISAPVSVSVDGFGNVGSQATLAVDGTPPSGFSPGFTPNPVALGASSALRFTIAGGTAAGSYTLGIKASSGSVVSNRVDIDVSVQSNAPGTPTLQSPANGASGIALRPTLQWQAVAGAQFYRLEVASDAGFSSKLVDIQVEDTSYMLFDALDYDSTYYWRVTALNACGNGVASAVRSFGTTSMVGSCPAGTVLRVLHREDFDSGLGSWTASSAAGPGGWVQSTARKASGSGSALSAGANATTDRRLTSPRVSLPSGLTQLGLRFDAFVSIEQSQNGCYDGGRLEISTDNGSTFTAVGNAAIQHRGYDGAIANGYDNPLAGTQAWCGYRPYFETYLVDLSAWAGQDVRLRFRSTSDYNYSEEGWYVDAVQVVGCEVPDPNRVFANGFED